MVKNKGYIVQFADDLPVARYSYTDSKAVQNLESVNKNTFVNNMFGFVFEY